jgi:hypothetical protein
MIDNVLTLLLSKLIELQLADNPPLKKFYNHMYTSYNPDVTGYTLLFMIPPEFSAKSYANNSKLESPNSFIAFLEMLDIMPDTVDTLNEFAKVYPFFATDFTPPQTQVQNAQVQSRTGAISYAADVIETESVTVQFIEQNPLVIYKFHLLWIEYIRDILKGVIKPDEKYINPNDLQHFGAQDYLGSFYVVKYILDMKEVSYIGKCFGVYPLTLPSKDLIGSRLTNEIAMLPIEYACVAYREWTDGLKTNKWLLTEFEEFVKEQFGGNWVIF